jgi:hypothetical protein
MFLEGAAPYSLAPNEKADRLVAELQKLVEHHREHCPIYDRFVADWTASKKELRQVEDFPFCLCLCSRNTNFDRPKKRE